MMENKIVDKVMEITNKGLKEKIEQQVREVHERAEKDRAIVENVIRLIQDGLMYKDVGHGSYHHYVLATEEMFFNDFMKKTRYEWDRGIKFTDADKVDNYRGVFSVNGERYYDMRYILDKYIKDVEDEMKAICNYNDRLREIKRAFDDIVSQAPAVEKMVKEWSEAREMVQHDSD